jgi:hypothetical protein
MKPLSGDRNQCPACSKYFNSSLAFEKHRTGQFGIDRRCMTTEEMLEKGMSEKIDGFWITKKKPIELTEKYLNV